MQSNTCLQSHPDCPDICQQTLLFWKEKWSMGFEGEGEVAFFSAKRGIAEIEQT